MAVIDTSVYVALINWSHWISNNLNAEPQLLPSANHRELCSNEQ